MDATNRPPGRSRPWIAASAAARSASVSRCGSELSYEMTASKPGVDHLANPAYIRLHQPDRDVPRGCQLSGPRHRGGAEIRADDPIAPCGQRQRLGTDAAGAVQHGRGGLDPMAGKQRAEHVALAPRAFPPVAEHQVVVAREVFVELVWVGQHPSSLYGTPRSHQRISRPR